MTPTVQFDQAHRQKAQAVLKARIAEGAKYRRDWLDAASWDLEAKKRGIKLPQWWVAPTPAALKKWLKTLRPGAIFNDVYGCSAQRLIELNPAMPLRAFVGQLLESADGS